MLRSLARKSWAGWENRMVEAVFREAGAGARERGGGDMAAHRCEGI